MAVQVDPTLPQSSFPYPTGSSTPGTPVGSEQLLSQSGPIPSKQGLYYINGNGKNLTLSLQTPIAGDSAKGGDDGNVIEMLNVDGGYHTITAGANVFNGSHALALLHDSASPPTVSRKFSATAYNGQWICNTSGITLT